MGDESAEPENMILTIAQRPERLDVRRCLSKEGDRMTHKSSNVHGLSRDIVVRGIIYHLAACAAVEPVTYLRIGSYGSRAIDLHNREESNKVEASQSAVQQCLDADHEWTGMLAQGKERKRERTRAG